MRRSFSLLIVALLAVVTACGASIQAVYEGDVRFEHCMALDSRRDVKPTLRSACWEEWVKFYTFGQTRDRVEYAKLRDKQLKAASNFDESDWAPQSRTLPAVPEPTSVLAPPPIKLATEHSDSAPDAGADADADGESAREGGPPPGSKCANTCEESWTLCREECKNPTCEKGCSAKYKRCMRKCF